MVISDRLDNRGRRSVALAERAAKPEFDLEQEPLSALKVGSALRQR